jgi:hypothetical protein
LGPDDRGPATKPGRGYNAWQNALRAERRARLESTWYLTLRIADPAAASETDEDEVRSFEGFDVDRRAGWPALIASRWLRILVAVALLAAATVFTLRTRQDQCGTVGLLAVIVLFVRLWLRQTRKT